MYSPKIKEQHIPTLYHLGKRKKKPMTYLVNEAIAEYLAKEDNHLLNDAGGRTGKGSECNR